MKYAKDNRIDLHENRFHEHIEKAKQLAGEFDFALPTPLTLEDGIVVSLRVGAIGVRSCRQTSRDVKSEISPNVDINTAQGRTTVKTAASNARGLVTQGTKAIPLFRIWKALTSAPGDPNFSKFVDAIPAARASLEQALGWHERQTADGKLRLKAIAAQSFLPVCSGDAECPLCEFPLNDESKKALASELEELKTNSDAAERKLGDACLQHTRNHGRLSARGGLCFARHHRSNESERFILKGHVRRIYIRQLVRKHSRGPYNICQQDYF